MDKSATVRVYCAPNHWQSQVSSPILPPWVFADCLQCAWGISSFTAATFVTSTGREALALNLDMSCGLSWWKKRRIKLYISRLSRIEVRWESSQWGEVSMSVVSRCTQYWDFYERRMQGKKKAKCVMWTVKPNRSIGLASKLNKRNDNCSIRRHRETGHCNESSQQAAHYARTPHDTYFVIHGRPRYTGSYKYSAECLNDKWPARDGCQSGQELLWIWIDWLTLFAIRKEGIGRRKWPKTYYFPGQLAAYKHFSRKFVSKKVWRSLL